MRAFVSVLLIGLVALAFLNCSQTPALEQNESTTSKVGSQNLDTSSSSASTVLQAAMQASSVLTTTSTIIELDVYEKEVQARFKTKESFGDLTEPNTVANYCLTAAKILNAAEAGSNYSPEFKQLMRATLIRSANRVMALSSGWDHGWGEPAGANQLVSRNLNMRTAFAWDTALPLLCLAEAHTLLAEITYRDKARSVALDWTNSLGYKATPTLCEGCGYFWYAYHSKLQGLYVKNTSIMMAAPMIQLGLILKNDKILKAGQGAMLSQVREIRSKNNYHYWGALEPGWNQERKWDGHNYIEAIALLRAGVVANNKSAVCTAVDQFETWTTGGRRAFSGEDQVEHDKRVALSACYFVRYSALAERECRLSVLKPVGNLTAKESEGLAINPRGALSGTSIVCN